MMGVQNVTLMLFYIALLSVTLGVQDKTFTSECDDSLQHFELELSLYYHFLTVQ